MKARALKILEIIKSGTGGRWGCPCCVGKRNKIAHQRAKRAARKQAKLDLDRES